MAGGDSLTHWLEAPCVSPWELKAKTRYAAHIMLSLHCLHSLPFSFPLLSFLALTVLHWPSQGRLLSLCQHWQQHTWGRCHSGHPFLGRDALECGTDGWQSVRMAYDGTCTGKFQTSTKGILFEQWWCLQCPRSVLLYRLDIILTCITFRNLLRRNFNWLHARTHGDYFINKNKEQKPWC